MSGWSKLWVMLRIGKGLTEMEPSIAQPTGVPLQTSHDLSLSTDLLFFLGEIPHAINPGSSIKAGTQRPSLNLKVFVLGSKKQSPTTSQNSSCSTPVQCPGGGRAVASIGSATGSWSWWRGFLWSRLKGTSGFIWIYPKFQWIGLRENLQETMVFSIKYRSFLSFFPSSNSMKVGRWVSSKKNIPFSGWKMSGWWFFATPLKNKILVSCGYEIPNIWNNKSNVPKHQPDVNSGIREDWFRLDSDPHTTSRIQWNPWYTKPPGIQIVLYNQSDNLWQSGTQRDRFLRKKWFWPGNAL